MLAAMEMVEGNNHPKTTPDRTNVEEIVEEEEDRISALPEGLLLDILSRLPCTKSAIRTGALSKRWKYLWTSVPVLIFYRNAVNHILSYFFFLVDKTLSQCRQLQLRKFAVYTRYDIRFESQVNNWIRYAISCHTQVLELWFHNVEAVFLLNGYFFIDSCFTELKLRGCMFNPAGSISWENLRSLHICRAYLDECLIENILTGSPLLETLVLDNCYGYRRLNITSKNVKKLVFTGYFDPDDEFDNADIIEINAPNIFSLTIEGDLVLWKLLLLNVSSLVEANLNYTKLGYRETTRKEAEEQMLKCLIQSLCHVKKINIGCKCSKVLVRLEAKGFIFSSNVKFPDVTYPDSDSD